MNIIIRCQYYRNGQLREEMPLRKGQRHGTVRTWHKNGVLASEEPYQAGLLHGVCRQWDETGKLLGKCRLVHGTGIQRAWHDNGRLQLEVSTVRGEFCGRNRIWLRDGTLISERFYLRGRVVSPEKYRAAAAADGALPKFRGKPAKLPANNVTTQRRIHRVATSWLLRKPNRFEALAWLRKEVGGKTARWLGRLRNARDGAKSPAAKFVEDLYRAGANEVIVPDVYRSKAGAEFADALLVRLPKGAQKRKAIRLVCARLKRRRLGTVQPDRERRKAGSYYAFGLPVPFKDRGSRRGGVSADPAPFQPLSTLHRTGLSMRCGCRPAVRRSAAMFGVLKD